MFALKYYKKHYDNYNCLLHAAYCMVRRLKTILTIAEKRKRVLRAIYNFLSVFKDVIRQEIFKRKNPRKTELVSVFLLKTL